MAATKTPVKRRRKNVSQEKSHKAGCLCPTCRYRRNERPEQRKCISIRVPLDVFEWLHNHPTGDTPWRVVADMCYAEMKKAGAK